MTTPHGTTPHVNTPHVSRTPIDFSRAMSNLARELSVNRSVDGRLNIITATSVKLIPGADCADILFLSARNRYESRAGTAGLPSGLIELQQTLDEGPCLYAAKDHPIVRCDNLGTDLRWPQFSRVAVESGIFSILSFQLHAGTENVGALNLYGFRPDAFSARGGADPAEIGGILATHASVAVVSARKESQLQAAVASRDIIGQAKGMIMERFDVDATRAFELLSKLSQDTNTPVHSVAAQLVRRQAVSADIEHL